MNYYFQKVMGTIVSDKSVKGIRRKAAAYIRNSTAINCIDVYSDKGYVGNVYIGWRPGSCPIWTARSTAPAHDTLGEPGDSQHVLNDDGSLGKSVYGLFPFGVHRN